MAFGIWVQAVDDTTGAANVEKYASIESYDDLYADGFAKEFCDGQTSPTAPRYPDDSMGMLWVNDRETADFIQGILREDIANRVAVEGLKLTAAPSWITAGNVVAGLTPEALTTVAEEIAEFVPAGISPSQIRTAMDAAMEAEMYAADDIIIWVKKNAKWMK